MNPLAAIFAVLGIAVIALALLAMLIVVFGLTPAAAVILVGALIALGWVIARG